MMWKKAVVAYLKYYPGICLEMNHENNSVRMAGTPPRF